MPRSMAAEAAGECVGCGDVVGPFRAFCSPTCQGIWGANIEGSPLCCTGESLLLAGFTLTGTPAFSCAWCGGMSFRNGAVGAVVIGPDGPWSAGGLQLTGTGGKPAW